MSWFSPPSLLAGLMLFARSVRFVEEQSASDCTRSNSTAGVKPGSGAHPWMWTTARVKADPFAPSPRSPQSTSRSSTKCTRHSRARCRACWSCWRLASLSTCMRLVMGCWHCRVDGNPSACCRGVVMSCTAVWRSSGFCASVWISTSTTPLQLPPLRDPEPFQWRMLCSSVFVVGKIRGVCFQNDSIPVLVACSRGIPVEGLDENEHAGEIQYLRSCSG